MTAAAFCYQNLFETASTVTATSEATGFEKENAYDWRTDDWWKPTSASPGEWTLTADMGTATAADYGAIYAHDLHTQGATIALQYATTDSPPAWVTAFTVTPTTSAPIVRTFTSQSKRYWRYLITGAAAPPSLGVLAFGARLDMEQGVRTGFAPPMFARTPHVMPHQAQNGAFLGMSVKRRGVEFNASFNAVTPAWLRSNWGTFQDHFETKPFFFSGIPASQETSGTATSGAAAYIVITDTTSPSDYYKDMIVTIESGTGAGQERTISTYSAGNCFVSPVWTTAPDATSVYSIRDPNYEDEAVFCWANGTQSAPIYSQEKFISINMDMVGLYL